MEYWQEFLRYEHASEVLIVLGGLLTLLSGWKIVKSSFKLLFWVVVAFAGGASASYGFKNSPYDLPALANQQLSDLRQFTPEISNDVLKVLCTRLNEITR